MEIKRRKIAIYGGTFSPPHLGHINAVQILKSQNIVDEVIVMPAFIPPNKSKAVGDTAKLRLEMCRAAFSNIDGVKVSDYEISRADVSYTVNTLEHIFANYDADIYLLIGTDKFTSLGNWRGAPRIFELAKIVLISRATEAKELVENKKLEYEKQYGAKIILINSEPNEVSSTTIRDKLARGNYDSLPIPKKVIEIIRREKLYQTSSRYE